MELGKVFIVAIDTRSESCLPISTQVNILIPTHLSQKAPRLITEINHLHFYLVAQVISRIQPSNPTI